MKFEYQDAHCVAWLAQPYRVEPACTVTLTISANKLVRLLNLADRGLRRYDPDRAYEHAACEWLAIESCRSVLSDARNRKPVVHRDHEAADYEWREGCSEMPRWYGVSYGNGNDGVSQLYPSFVVHTHDPFLLARAAMVAQFKPEWQSKAIEECDVDGEADYTVQACILDPLDSEPCEECDDVCECASHSDHNGAAHLVDVFPIELDLSHMGIPQYESIAEAVGLDVLAKIGDK